MNNLLSADILHNQNNCRIINFFGSKINRNIHFLV